MKDLTLILAMLTLIAGCVSNGKDTAYKNKCDMDNPPLDCLWQEN